MELVLLCFRFDYFNFYIRCDGYFTSILKADFVAGGSSKSYRSWHLGLTGRNWKWLKGLISQISMPTYDDLMRNELN